MRTLCQNGGRWLRLSLLGYRALFSWLNPLDYLTIKILEPMAQLLFFTFLGQFAGFDPAYFALGNAVRLASISGLYGSVMVMIEERMSGTLPLVVAASTPIGQTLVTRVALQGLDGLLTTALGLTVSFLFLGLDAGSVQWLWLLPALLITSYAIAALGLFVSIFGVFGVDLGFVMNFVYTLLLLFCGVNFPITLLPPALQLVAHLLPLTHGLLAIRAIVAGDLTGVPFHLFLETVIGCGYALSGYLLFRYAEYRARVQGTLDFV
ncbi:MAG: ABC transporter permease [Caldilinea sp. CFX5]|nr:ABC transporter permease [Caldilinea sp. CFX5]